MKHNVTPLKGENELLVLKELMFRNFFLETRLGCYITQPSMTPPDTLLGLIPCPIGENETCTIHCNKSSSSDSNTSLARGPCTYDMWPMYFDGSKTQEGSRDGCVLTDTLQRKHLIYSHLDFECTKNTTKYEALIFVLYKSINLKVVVLKVVGDLEIAVRQVGNTTDFVSLHLKIYLLMG